MEKLNCKSLMIGDYLMHNGLPYRVIQVDGIVRDGWMIENGEEDCGEPIPITPEILKKNGLRISEHGECFEEDEHCMVEISVDREGIKWTINCHEYCIMTFRYVHELQNALRLTGVNKEIEL